MRPKCAGGCQSGSSPARFGQKRAASVPPAIRAPYAPPLPRPLRCRGATRDIVTRSMRVRAQKHPAPIAQKLGHPSVKHRQCTPRPEHDTTMHGPQWNARQIKFKKRMEAHTHRNTLPSFPSLQAQCTQPARCAKCALSRPIKSAKLATHHRVRSRKLRT